MPLPLVLDASIARFLRLALALAAAVALVTVPTSVRADAGDPDAGFGEGGRVNTDFFHHLDGARAIAVQSDGKIVAGGYISKQANDPSIDFGLVRYMPDGSLDPDFGNGGRVITDFAANFDEVKALAIQPDGKIVAVGFADRPSTLFDVAIARYLPNGTPDSGFGTGGKTTVDISGNDDFGESVAILANGAILVGGLTYTSANGEDFALVRFTPDGHVDSTFAGGGKTTTDFFHQDDEITSLAVTDDGSIVVAGLAFKSATKELFALAKYTPNGILDGTFGDGGRMTEDRADLLGVASAVVIEAGGRVVVGGSAPGAGLDFTLVGFTEGGQLDATFGTGGITKTNFFGFDDRMTSLIVVGDHLVAAGSARHGSSASSSDMAIARYDLDGLVDEAFGVAGVATLDFYGREDVVNAIAVDVNGNLVVGGAIFNSSDQDFGIARFEGDPPEPDFSLSLAEPTLTVQRGQKGAVDVQLVRTAGFGGVVTVTAPDTKAIKVKLTPAQIATDGSVATFAFKIKKKAAAGTYPLEFAGTDGAGRMRSVTLSLVIR